MNLRLALVTCAVAVTLTACSGSSATPNSVGTASSPTEAAGTTPSSALAVSSAASSPTATTASPDPVSPSASSGAGGGGAAEFVAVVRDKVAELGTGRSDAEIAAVATTACASLRRGVDADSILAVTRSLGTLDAEATDEATARELIKLAIDTVCLDQAPRVDEFRAA